MKQLIKTAKEKGFSTKAVILMDGMNPEKLKDFENEFIFYLWLCELQKWLRENKALFLTVGKEYNNLDLFYFEVSYNFKLPDGATLIEKENFKTYEQALESGLMEALKLI